MFVYICLIGGTVDVTAHQVTADGKVKEIIRPTGGNWGGTRVDEEYIDLIKCLIGETAIKDINQNASSAFFEASREFESAKRTIKPKSDTKFNVRIPIQIGEIYMKTYPGKDLRSVDSVTTKIKKQINISFTGDKLRLLSSDAEDLFSQSVRGIIEHLKRLLKQENGKGISTIIFVDGYAESQILITAVKTSFPHMRTIIPKSAAWSVLQGAVIFGHDPSLIKQRRSKYSYGISVFEKFDPKKHDEKYKYEKDGKLRCGKLFSKLVELDEIITDGEYQKEDYYEIDEHSMVGNLGLYSSTSKNPKYIDEEGCFFIGCILNPGHDFLLNEEIVIKMCFGRQKSNSMHINPKVRRHRDTSLDKNNRR